MEFSADLFEKTLRRIKGDARENGAQRRRLPRLGIRCQTKLWPAVRGQVGKALDVSTRDISLNGLCVLSRRALKVGTHYLISLPYPEFMQREARLLYCTVRYCKAAFSGSHAIGLSFEELGTRRRSVEDVELMRIRQAILA